MPHESSETLYLASKMLKKPKPARQEMEMEMSYSFIEADNIWLGPFSQQAQRSDADRSSQYVLDDGVNIYRAFCLLLFYVCRVWMF